MPDSPNYYGEKGHDCMTPPPIVAVSIQHRPHGEPSARPPNPHCQAVPSEERMWIRWDGTARRRHEVGQSNPSDSTAGRVARTALARERAEEVEAVQKKATGKPLELLDKEWVDNAGNRAYRIAVANGMGSDEAQRFENLARLEASRNHHFDAEDWLNHRFSLAGQTRSTYGGPGLCRVRLWPGGPFGTAVAPDRRGGSCGETWPDAPHGRQLRRNRADLDRRAAGAVRRKAKLRKPCVICGRVGAHE